MLFSVFSVFNIYGMNSPSEQNPEHQTTPRVGLDNVPPAIELQRSEDRREEDQPASTKTVSEAMNEMKQIFLKTIGNWSELFGKRNNSTSSSKLTAIEDINNLLRQANDKITKLNDELSSESTAVEDKGGDGKVRQIKLSDYDMGETLGTGSFGRVKIAKDKKTGEYVAMKIMKKAEILKSKQADHISNEIKILSMIDHPFVITFGGFTQDDRNLYLALELINGGELFTYLRGVGRFPVDQARVYIAQIVLIFDYLHNKNIIYRDLKPENILIHKSGYLKLTDFGFAKIVEGRTYTLCGTPEYLAPEIILNKGHGKPVDWWTCGILLYEMIAGIDPFSDDDPMMVYQKILKGKIKFPSGFDSNAKSLIKHLLDSDLTKRYGNLKNGVKDITGHRFFKNLEWDKLLKKELPPPYVPKVKSNDDISNFSAYPDSDNPAPQIKKDEDPFLDWFKN